MEKDGSSDVGLQCLLREKSDGRLRGLSACMVAAIGRDQVGWASRLDYQAKSTLSSTLLQLEG